MKRKLLPVVMSLCLGGVIAMPAFAAATQDNTQAQKIKLLEQKLADLQEEVSALQQGNTDSNANLVTTHKYHKRKANKLTQAQAAQAHQATQAAQNKQNANPIQGPSTLPTTGSDYFPVDVNVPGQSFVSSGPYIGVPLEYSGSNLIVNSPTINEDVTLLNIRKNVRQRLTDFGHPEQGDRSHLLLSGIVETQAMYKDPGVGSDQSDIDLTTVNLDTFIMGPSNWTSGFVELSFDNSIGVNTGEFNSEARTVNSRVFVNKAFIVLGDFQKSPFYVTMGQLYMPFGTYSTTMISSPLTKTLARVQARAIVLGYKQQAPNSFYAATYIFKGDSHASETSHVNNGGINLGYSFTTNRKFSVDVGVGVIANMADSVGMQDTGNDPLFCGFGGDATSEGDTEACGNEKLVHRVPAYDVHTILGVGSNLQFIGEYITASTDFNTQDMSINGHGAKPQAANAELVYTLPMFRKPTSISIGYGMSKDALAIGLPAKRYSFVINRSFWKSTLQTLEFRHDIDYNKNDTSSGSSVAGPNGSGKASNTVTAQFDYYF